MTPAAPVTTILVVDDDRVQRLVVERALGRSGYSVVTATSAAEGLAAAERHHPALVISDHYMPGQDGFAFCRAIRSNPDLAGTMFMLLTAAQETERRVEGLDPGADDYLVKPVDVDELRSRVRALLRIKALHDELERDRRELARLNAILGQGLSGVLTLLSHLVGRRVPGALQRGEQAASLVRWISTRAGMDETEVRAMEVAARVHEIGKIDLPDAILARPAGALTEDERSHLAQFPLIGAGLVQNVAQLEPLAPILRHQLENYDGTGIPDGLRGSEIPAGARILRLVNLIEEARARGRAGTAELVEVVDRAQGSILGPRLARLAIEFLETQVDASWRDGKRQVTLDDLEPGMIIAVDLCTERGIKLLSRDSTLSRAAIDRIRSYQVLDPILDEIYVYDAPAAARS